VTFLFTDIESSSSRWEADAVEMRATLARHDELLGEAIAGSGGVVFKHLGDGLCAAFSSAPDALQAAESIIRAVENDFGLGAGRCGCGLGYTPGQQHRPRATISVRR
jgi:class 3 adenylate cyclase